MQLTSRFLKHITKSHTLDTVKDIGRFPHINQRIENGLRVRTNIRAGETPAMTLATYQVPTIDEIYDFPYIVS